MCKLSVIRLLVLWLVAWTRPTVLLGQGLSLQQVVDSFYPQILIDAANKVGQGANLQRTSCFTIYSPSTLIAGYSNGVLGDVLVLGFDGNKYNLVYDSNAVGFTGSDCNIELVDIDRDGTSEVEVSFDSLSTNSIDWLFKWDGTKLINIGPVTNDPRGRLTSSVMNIDFLDLHAATLDVTSVGEYPPPLDGSSSTSPIALYRFLAGKFQRTALPLLFEYSFTQSTNQSTKEIFNFTKPLVPGPYSLLVANGNYRGQSRFSGGSILVNGKLIVQAGLLNTSTGMVTVPVSLASQNTITLDLTGALGSVIAVIIQGQPSGDLNDDGRVDCQDLEIVKNSLGKKAGQTGFNSVADVNLDGVVDIKDLAIVASQLPSGSVCQ